MKQEKMDLQKLTDEKKRNKTQKLNEISVKLEQTEYNQCKTAIVAQQINVEEIQIEERINQSFSTERDCDDQKAISATEIKEIVALANEENKYICELLNKIKKELQWVKRLNIVLQT